MARRAPHGATQRPRRLDAALCLSTVGLDALFGGPISGESMNPARSPGPALASGDLHALWTNLAAPLLAAALGAFAYQLVRSDETSHAELADNEADG